MHQHKWKKICIETKWQEKLGIERLRENEPNMFRIISSGVLCTLENLALSELVAQRHFSLISRNISSRFLIVAFTHPPTHPLCKSPSHTARTNLLIQRARFHFSTLYRVSKHQIVQINVIRFTFTHSIQSHSMALSLPLIPSIAFFAFPISSFLIPLLLASSPSIISTQFDSTRQPSIQWVEFNASY